MIDSSLLLDDLRKLLRVLESNLRERCETEDAVNAPVSAEYQAARKAGRTVQAFEEWREEYLTQVSVAWLLGCVFVRFLEDNGLIDPMLSGPGDRMGLARDARDSYFKQHKLESDRDYLVSAFRKVEKLPCGAQLFDERHNPLWRVPISGDRQGAGAILELLRKVDPETGELVHDFSDRNWDTRFLGDLYQDLSEEVRSKYALLQTPVFVEEFILDRTLTPAIDEFGFNEVRLIDPTCGSGHFLLGAFARLLALWQRYEPATNVRALVQRALDQVYGIDLNPYATAIARFRLLLAALRASEVARLNQAPNFRINVATGDSLLHGRRFTGDYTLQKPLPNSPDRHLYEAEDGPALERILGQQYHAVVGNPPYITVKERALNDIYRQRYKSCHMKYSLVVPFMERFFDLALRGEERSPGGFVGMIVGNSFMKREFGKKLIEMFIPQWDLTNVVDTSGAYIPGHGTPTAVIFGRNRKPVLSTVRAVMGIRGEPSTPKEPAHGQVWTEIITHLDDPGSMGEFVSVADSPREMFHHHPWSLGGGGASELRSDLENNGNKILGGICAAIGPLVITGDQECFIVESGYAARRQLRYVRPLGTGETIRDWRCDSDLLTLWPNRKSGERLRTDEVSEILTLLWPYRATLSARKVFGTPISAKQIPWWALGEVYSDKLRSSLTIAYAEVASHNHFVLDRGSNVFNQTAPAVKLSPDAGEHDHLVLLGLLNSSTACFWMKQVSHQKQMMGGDGIRVTTKSKVPYQFSCTAMSKFPVPREFLSGEYRERLLRLAIRADKAAAEMSNLTPAIAIADALARMPNSIERTWHEFQGKQRHIRSELIFLQEQMDFVVYRMFGLCDDSILGPDEMVAPDGLEAGERPFEILAGENQDGFAVSAEIRREWPDDARQLWESRIAAIRKSRELSLIEDPHYKRRWIGRQGLFNWSATADAFHEALRKWLLDRLEGRDQWPRVELTSCARLAERVANDSDFMQVAQLYRGRPDFDLTGLVVELVQAESVPHLPEQRYKESGLRKRDVWERTWDLQRKEDEIDGRTRLPEQDPKRLTEQQAGDLKAREIGELPVPPKYKTADFIKGSHWSLRGPLDVPKERFISYPKCERRGDPTPVIGWAGWNHLQQAQALAEWYDGARKEGWSPDQLKSMLAGLMELLPWLKQWYNELNPEYGLKMADFFSDYLDQQLLELDFSREDLRRL